MSNADTEFRRDVLVALFDLKEQMNRFEDRVVGLLAAMNHDQRITRLERALVDVLTTGVKNLPQSGVSEPIEAAHALVVKIAPTDGVVNFTCPGCEAWCQSEFRIIRDHSHRCKACRQWITFVVEAG